jgi:hypothetical protein
MSKARLATHQLDYEIDGDAAGTPLLLIMCLGGSSRGWQALQVPEFSGQHRTITYDHRGVGESEDPGGAFSTADLADDAAQLLDVPRHRARTCSGPSWAAWWRRSSRCGTRLGSSAWCWSAPGRAPTPSVAC